MADWVLALFLILIGAVFALRGYVSMRIAFALWGALTGFALGAGAVAAITGDSFLSTAVGWVVGLVCALVLAALAYLWYELSVVLAMAAIGYVLGAAIMALLGVEWQWLVALAGVAAGVLLALAALRFDLPGVLLILLTAAGGATAVVAGFMLIAGTFDADELSRATVTERLNDSIGWWIVYAAIALAGVIVQTAGVRGAVAASSEERWKK